MKPRWEGIVGWLLLAAGLYFVGWAVIETMNVAPLAGAALVLAGWGHLFGLLPPKGGDDE